MANENNPDRIKRRERLRKACEGDKEALARLRSEEWDNLYEWEKKDLVNAIIGLTTDEELIEQEQETVDEDDNWEDWDEIESPMKIAGLPVEALDEDE